MALNFPVNPTLDQLYQTGSSATYQWNGLYWVISAPIQTGLTILTASYSERVANIQSLPPTTGTGSFWYDIDTGNSYIKYGTNWVPVQSNTVNATSASFATNSTTSSFASSIGILNQSVQITGSTRILGNLNVQGTASFSSVTASSVLVNQNTITVFGSGSLLPNAGYLAVDTASQFSSGSFLYSFPSGSWISNSPITASFFFGTASVANGLTSSLSQSVNITGSLRVSGSITGSLFGTASFASTSSFINTLNQPVTISGSFTVFTGSNVELQVTNTGVKIGNQLIDTHTITGSLRVSGSITGSLFGSASFATSASFSVSSSRAVSALFAVTSSTNTLAYGAIGFTALPTLTNNDATPSLLNGNGVTTSGNTIIIERPGVYLLNANLPFRGNFAEYRWTDASNNQLVGTILGLAGSVTSPDPIATSPATGIVNITTANTIVKLRTGNVSTMGTQVPGYASATITQIR